MFRKSSLIFLFVFVLLVSFSFAGEGFKVGEAVYAQWTPNSWYHGKITKPCAAGWHVLFDDGDNRCCTKDELVRDMVPKAVAVKTGARVLAQWTNSKFYPGTVEKVEKNEYSIKFNDGDKAKVKLTQIRLRQ